MGRTAVIFLMFSQVSRAGDGESLVSDGMCKQCTAPRTCHTQTLASSLAHFMSYAQCCWLDRILCPLPHGTPSLLYPLKGSAPCNPQQGVSLVVWSNRGLKSACRRTRKARLLGLGTDWRMCHVVRQHIPEDISCNGRTQRVGLHHGDRNASELIVPSALHLLSHCVARRRLPPPRSQSACFFATPSNKNG